MKDITKDQLADARKQIEILEKEVEKLKITIIQLPMDGEIRITNKYWKDKFLPIIERELTRKAISYRITN